MSGNASSQAPGKEYVVRLPKRSRKKYHMMRFGGNLGIDFFKTMTECKMERENNLKEYKMQEEIPKFGAGSEYGREQREEARRKRYGINIKKYKPENQPWLLNTGGKNGKKYKGIREGGVSDNSSYYVFMQASDGAFEAFPISEWYNFQPIQRYKALSAEEAEEEFVKRDKIMNYFQVMYGKKLRSEGDDATAEEGKTKGHKKSLLLSEMDDWISDDDEDADDEGEERKEDSDDGGNRKKKKRRNNRKKLTGGKKKTRDGGGSDNSCEEESDEYNEGAEHDYVSSDSSDSDQENDEIVVKELAGVEEGDALKKLLKSEEEDDEDENKENEEEENTDADGKKKKKKKKRGKSDKDDSPGHEPERIEDGSRSEEVKNIVNKLKRKENLDEMVPNSKRRKLDPSVPSGSKKLDPSVPSGSKVLVSESEANLVAKIRKYLTKKPMTTVDLLKLFIKKGDENSEQQFNKIVDILKKLNPAQLKIKGKTYLTLKPS